MSVIAGFTIVVMLLFLAYMGYRLFLRRTLLTVVAFCLQLFSLTISMISFINNVQTINELELVFILCGVVVPGIFVVADYRRMIKKVREQGIFKGFVEAIPRKTEDSQEISLSRKYIKPIIGERQVGELVQDLNISKDDIMSNIKKSLFQAHTCMDKADYDNAYEIYSALLKLVTNSPGLYFNHGNICYYREAYAEALRSYKKVVEISEECESYRVYYNMGNVLFRLNRFEQAVECYKKALDINPSLEDAHENIARALICLEKKDEAIAHFKKVVENDSRNYKPYYIIARLYSESERYSEAVEALESCLRLNPSFAEAYEELGRANIMAGNY